MGKNSTKISRKKIMKYKAQWESGTFESRYETLKIPVLRRLKNSKQYYLRVNKILFNPYLLFIAKVNR